MISRYRVVDPNFNNVGSIWSSGGQIKSSRLVLPAISFFFTLYENKWFARKGKVGSKRHLLVIRLEATFKLELCENIEKKGSILLNESISLLCVRDIM